MHHVKHAFGHVMQKHGTDFSVAVLPLFAYKVVHFAAIKKTLSNKMRHLFPKTGPLLICACKEPSEFQNHEMDVSENRGTPK